MDFDRRHSLAFLFSLGALPIAGCGGGDDGTTGTTNADTTTGTSNTTTATTTTATTTDSTTADTSATTADATTTTATTTDATSTTDATTTDSTTTTDATTTGASSESTTGGAVDPSCAALAAKYTECYPRYAPYEAEFAAYCTDYLVPYYDMYSAECGMAFDDAVACIAMADCAELMAGTACTEEIATQSMVCGGGTTSAGSSDGSGSSSTT